LDTASRLLVVETEAGRVIKREYFVLPDLRLSSLTEFVVDLGIDTLICGAISRPLFSRLLSSKVGIYPWITGEVEDVLKAYLDNELSDERFLAPGFGRCRKGRERRHSGGSRRRGRR